MKISCFTPYDVRGELGVNIDPSVCYKISRAFCKTITARSIVVGHDARETSPEFAQAVINGALDSGVNVFELGLCGTEEMYFATNQLDTCGGIEVTASHNPKNFNGLKMVKSGACPLDPITEMKKVRQTAEESKFQKCQKRGSIVNISEQARAAYIKKVISFIDVADIRKIHLVINSGNGAAGPSFNELAKSLLKINQNLLFTHINPQPDPSFPNGVPNPLIFENRTVTANAVIEKKADFGVAFDGDFDRCFFFDERGRFISGEYIVGLLARTFLEKTLNETVVHDSRIVWSIRNIINKNNGHSFQSRTGHAFFKQAMRERKAVYGGELSSHHYFRDFFYCDSGMIPWLLIMELISKTKMPLSKLIEEQERFYPSSGEVNFQVSEPTKVIKTIRSNFKNNAKLEEYIDGLSMEFEDWRFNLRCSNTEPILRLCIESNQSRKLVEKKLKEISLIINSKRN